MLGRWDSGTQCGSARAGACGDPRFRVKFHRHPPPPWIRLSRRPPGKKKKGTSGRSAGVPGVAWVQPPGPWRRRPGPRAGFGSGSESPGRPRPPSGTQWGPSRGRGIHGAGARSLTVAAARAAGLLASQAKLGAASSRESVCFLAVLPCVRAMQEREAAAPVGVASSCRAHTARLEYGQCPAAGC